MSHAVNASQAAFVTRNTMFQYEPYARLLFDTQVLIYYFVFMVFLIVCFSLFEKRDEYRPHIPFRKSAKWLIYELKYGAW